MDVREISGIIQNCTAKIKNKKSKLHCLHFSRLSLLLQSKLTDMINTSTFYTIFLLVFAWFSHSSKNLSFQVTPSFLNKRKKSFQENSFFFLWTRQQLHPMAVPVCFSPRQKFLAFDVFVMVT